MNLYHVSQDVNNNYDTYSDFVIACASEEEARNTTPDGNKNEETPQTHYSHWTWPANVKVKLIGTAAEGITGVICSSYHAG
jgi:hypothetical protein